MLGTCATDRREFLRDRLPCTVQSYRGVVGRCRLGLSKRFDCHSTKVNLFNRSAILALQDTDHVSDAGTDCLRHLSLVADRCFGGERLMGAGTSGSSPIVVSNGIPKNAIEPRDRALVITYFGTVFNSLQVRRLENVLRSRPVFDTGRQKAQKS